MCLYEVGEKRRRSRVNGAGVPYDKGPCARARPRGSDAVPKLRRMDLMP